MIKYLALFYLLFGSVVYANATDEYKKAIKEYKEALKEYEEIAIQAIAKIKEVENTIDELIEAVTEVKTSLDTNKHSNNK